MSIEKLEAVLKEIETIRDRIGDGCADDDLSNTLLENSTGDQVMTGQAYEDLAIAYHCLHRATETITDLIGEAKGPEDKLTVMIIYPANKYLKDFVNNPNRITAVDEQRIEQVKEIIEMICSNNEPNTTCGVECTEACNAMKFIIRQMLWSCELWTHPKKCEEYKNLIYENTIGDFG